MSRVRALTAIIASLLFVLVFDGSVRAQGTISNLTCETRDRAAALRFTISPVIADDAVRCFYDYDAASLDRRTQQIAAESDNGGLRECAMYGLPPDTDVYIGPQTSDPTKTSWSALLRCSRACTSCTTADATFFGDDGSGSSGCDCGAAGEVPKLHTDSEDLDPTPDAPVHTGRSTPPTVTGASYVVAPDCSDLVEKKADAEADAGDGDVVELVLPAGVPCGTRGFRLTSIPNGGWVIVRSSADPRLLPPPGAMTDRTYLPYLAILTWAEMGQWGYQTELVTADDDARGYYFENVSLGPPALDSPSLAPVTVAISGVDVATDTITVPSTVGLLQQGALSGHGSGEVVVVDLGGTQVRGGYGPMHACNVTPTTFQLFTGVTNKGCFGGTLVDLTGSSCSGDCGSVRRFVALPIEGWSDCGGSQCITIHGHGIPSFPDMTITAGSAGTLTVAGTPAEYQIENDTVVHVAGTTRATCDGLWNASVSGSVLVLSRDGSASDCSGVAGGTVHRHRAVSIFRTNTDALGGYAPRAFNVEPVDADTLRLLETAPTSGVSGGYLFWDMESLGRIVALDAGARATSVEDVVLDRVVSLSCMPWLSQSWASFVNSQHVSLVNSYIEHCMWQRVNPVNDRNERVHGLYQAPAFQLNGAEDLAIDDNHLWPQTFLFADDDHSGPDTHVDDLSITRNYLWKPDWTTRGTEQWRGHYFHASFPIELKSAGSRTSISANHFRGWLSNFQQTQPAIELSLNGSRSAFDNGYNNIAIDDNVFDHGATVLQVATDLGIRTADKRYLLTEKLRFAGNLISHIDSVRYTGAAGNSSGQMVSIGPGLSDFVIERNTYAPDRCVNCRVLEVGGTRGSGVRVRDNVFVLSQGDNTNRLGVATLPPGGELPPLTESGGYAAFQEIFWRGTETDVGHTSEWSGNIAIPGLVASNAASYDMALVSTDPAVTHCRSSLESMDKILDLPFTWIGSSASPCDDSLATRLGLVFEPGTFVPLAAYAGKGADPAALSDAQGLVGPVTVTGGADGLTIAYHAPTTESCTVDVAPWTGSWASTWSDAESITRTTADAGGQSQSVALTGLVPGAQYAYRIFCRKTAIGLVTLAGGP